MSTDPLPLNPALGSIQPPGQHLTKPLTYSGFIPRLNHLLPMMKGRPGLEYAQIAVQNMRLAQDGGWIEIDGTFVYTIVGPKGSVDAKLFGRGRVIPGQSHMSGKRKLFCDPTIVEVTGLEANPGDSKELTSGEVEKPEGDPQGPQGGAQDPKGDGGVQKRDAGK